MRKMKYTALVFICLAMVLSVCTPNKGEDGEKKQQDLSNKETAVEVDFPDAQKAIGQILVLNEDSMIVQMHYPGAKLGTLETRTIHLNDCVLQKEFAKGEFVKILFNNESNKADVASGPGLGSGIIDNKTDLNDVYMICSVL